jgi:Domain of unknown function (DUF4372)
MNQGKLVFAQIMEHLPLTTLRRCVARYDGEHKVKHFSCLDQYLCMAFAQLTWRESLRDIEACLRAHSTKLYHSRHPAFFGTTENAVKTQIRIAVSVYILIAIVKKRLSCSASLYEMLQILSLTMFERTPINRLLSQQPQISDERVSPNQLSLFA